LIKVVAVSHSPARNNYKIEKRRKEMKEPRLMYLQFSKMIITKPIRPQSIHPTKVSQNSELVRSNNAIALYFSPIRPFPSCTDPSY